MGGARGADLKRLAIQKGLSVQESGTDVTLTIMASTPEDALEKLGIVAAFLSQKGRVP